MPTSELDNLTLGEHNVVIEADNADVTPRLPDSCLQLIYLDPPFNTGNAQRRKTFTATADTDGSLGATREGFSGRRYVMTETSRLSYADRFDDYFEWLAPRLIEARRLLTESGTLYLHLDWRESHYAKVALDEIFGRDAFLNEIIWAYDYGGRKRDRWPAKHDTILVYVKTPGRHFFSQDQIERIPYLAPGLVTPEKRERGKLPTDVWWHTIVPTNSKEKTGYPTQKPLGIARRIISASSQPGDWVADFFAGSGTTGAAAAELGRRFLLTDRSPDAIEVIRTRLGDDGVHYLRAPDLSPSE